MSALSLVIITASIITLLAWLRSILTGDMSQVDRLWSIVPEIYIWILVFKDHFHNQLLFICAVLVSAWGIRLTFNFARKGGYRGEEDYRWEVLRKQMSKVQFQIFNFFFISLYQNFLLVMITIPAFYIYQHQAKLNGATLIMVFAFIGALIGETIADQQQWNFYQARKNGNTFAIYQNQIVSSIGYFEGGSKIVYLN